MIRLESSTGWWLTTHPDHARLAATFAEHWGNDLFAPPEPRAHVLHGIATHDDGWVLRDRAPLITREGKPSAFSTELVGKYSAFEEINLADYLSVRDRAVRLVADSDAYAAILISMHTYNLLTERADRLTIAPEQLPLLDKFLAQQKSLQDELFLSIQQDGSLPEQHKSRARIEDNFRLLQAVDNLSLLSCVDYWKPGTLLHALPLKGAGVAPVKVEALGERTLRLTPYPLDLAPLTVQFPGRHIEGKAFADSAALQRQYSNAKVTDLSVTITA